MNPYANSDGDNEAYCVSDFWMKVLVIFLLVYTLGLAWLYIVLHENHVQCR